MDDTVIRASCGEQHGLFSKNGVGKPLRHLHPPSKWNCKSVLTCMSVSARSTVFGRHSGSATIRKRPAGKKKTEKESSFPQPEWQEGAGSLLLLASAHQTGLLTELQTALSPSHLTIDPSLRLAHHQPATLRSQLLTLLFLETVGLQRIWDLRGYTGQALALLTGRRRAYGYRHTERFLAELARSGADVPLTEVLARWTATLWKPKSQGRESPGSVFYVDGHHKPVYADALIPRPLFVTTHRGDQHLTLGLPILLMHYEQAAGLASLKRDLEALCAKVAKAQLRLPDGRSLFFRLHGAAVIPLLDAQEVAVA
jgi:hypothetical protein